MAENDPAFHVYIDEAGDPGVRTKRPSELTAPDWFIISAAVVSDARDSDVVDWVRDMREAVRAQQRTSLHYRNLSASNQKRVCRMLASKHVRLFTVASHKTNMRGRQNPRMGKALGRGEFYNWCLRLLLERVSDWCDRRARKECGHTRPMKITFSERGGHDYQHLGAYLQLLDQQARTGGLVLSARRIVPGTVVPDLCSARPHDSVAGLQIADIVASAFFQAVNTGSATHSLDAAKSLRPRIAREKQNRSAASYGVMLLPLPHQGTIPDEAKPIFEHYGYRFV